MALADDFTADNLGKPVEVADPTNLDQCMDWAMAWCQRLGVPIAAITHLYAYQVFTQPTSVTRQYFDTVPYQSGMIPPAGALVVFSPAIGGVAGHIAVALSGSSRSQLITSDQNWDGRLYIQRVYHSYTFVMGWLVSKNNQGGSMAASQDTVDQTTIQLEYNNALLRNATSDEIAPRIQSGQTVENLQRELQNSPEHVQIQYDRALGQQARAENWLQQISDLKASLAVASAKATPAPATVIIDGVSYVPKAS